MRFPHLFRPGRIGPLEVRNRIIGSPMERNYCTAEGRVTQRYIDYMAARARGGVGLMYTEATYVDPRGKGRDAADGPARRRPDPATSRGWCARFTGTAASSDPS